MALVNAYDNTRSETPIYSGVDLIKIIDLVSGRISHKAGVLDIGTKIGLTSLFTHVNGEVEYIADSTVVGHKSNYDLFVMKSPIKTRPRVVIGCPAAFVPGIIEGSGSGSETVPDSDLPNVIVKMEVNFPCFAIQEPPIRL